MSSTYVTDDFEIIHPEHPRGRFRFCLFDFDGTLSLIREGWQEVMIPMMVKVLLETCSGESAEELELIVGEYVAHLTGKQTIYQMIRLKEEVEQRGGVGLDLLEYKRMYLESLWRKISHRVAGLNDGTILPEQMLVPGSMELLRSLKERGVSLFLASGTDLEYVRDEANALGITEFFDGGIFGALDEYWRFSKKLLIEHIFRENQLSGPELLTFGDGYVEIENTKEANGVAVGVASDEAGRGRVDAWKRDRLIRAGADLIIPHYCNHEALIAYLFAEERR